MSLAARPAFTLHTLQDKMDLAIGVALGSSIQIAIFVLPLVVIIGWAIGKPLTLDLDPFLIMILTLSVIHANFVSSDGQSNWWVPASSSACLLLLQAHFAEAELAMGLLLPGGLCCNQRVLLRCCCATAERNLWLCAGL